MAGSTHAGGLGVVQVAVRRGMEDEGAVVTENRLRHRERKMLLMRAVFASLQVAVAGAVFFFGDGYFAKPRSKCVRRDRRSFRAITASLTDKEFRSNFRLQRRSFAKLLEMIRAEITRDEAMARLSGNGPIEAECCLG